MVSRTELIEDIESKIKDIDARRSNVSSQINEQRGIISQSKPVTREPLPQRRFGLNVQKVKEQQQRILQRRQQAKQNISSAESNIAQLKKEGKELAEVREKLVKERKTLEQIPEIERRRMEDIRAGRIKVRRDGELIPYTLDEDREETITITEIPPQYLVPPRAKEQDIVKMSVGQKIVASSEKSLQQIDALFFPKEAEQNRLIEQDIKQHRAEAEKLNLDIAIFNQEFGGRRLTEAEVTKAEKRAKALDIRQAELGFQKAQLKLDIKTTERFQKEEARTIYTKGKPLSIFQQPIRFTKSIIAGAGGFFLSIPPFVSKIKEVYGVKSKDKKIYYLGGGISEKNLASGQREAKLVSDIGKSAYYDPAKFFGTAVGTAVVSYGIGAVTRTLIPKKTPKIIELKPKVKTTSTDIIIPITEKTALAGYKVTQKVGAGGILLESTKPKDIMAVLGKQKYTKGYLFYEPLYDPTKIKPITLYDLYKPKSVTKGVIIRVSKPFKRETFLVKPTLLDIKTGKLLLDPVYKTVREEGKIATGIIKGQILPKKYKVYDIAKLDKFTQAQLRALSEARAGVPTREFLFPKGTLFQKGFAFSEELLKLTRAGKKSLVPLGKRIERAELLTTFKEYKALKIPAVKLYKTETAFLDVTRPRFRVRPESVKTMKGITAVIDLKQLRTGDIILDVGKPIIVKKEQIPTLTTKQTGKLIASLQSLKVAKLGKLKIPPLKYDKIPVTSQASQITKATAIVTPATKVTQKLTPKVAQLPKIETRVAQRLTPKVATKLITKQTAKVVPKLTTRQIPKLVTKSISKLTTKQTTKLLPKLALVTLPKAVPKFPSFATPKFPVVKTPKIPPPPLLIPIGLRRSEIPKPKKKKREKYISYQYYVPSVTARAFKITIPKEKINLGKTFTGLELRRIPV